MNLLPNVRFYLVTSLKPEEVEAQLQEYVAPEKKGWDRLFVEEPDKPFLGYAANGHFRFTRVIKNRNSFLPVIEGKIEAWLNGSILHAKARLTWPVAIFICLWLVCVLFAGIKIIVQSVIDREFWVLIFVPFVFIALGYAMMMAFYTYELNKAKEMLLKIFPGRIEDTENIAYRS